MTKKLATAAAIDLGTNSFRLLLGELREGFIERRHVELDTVRLGEGFESSGRLSSSALQRAGKVFEKYARLLKGFAPSRLLICGTEVLRRAANSRQLLSKAENILGQTPIIIDGSQEAFLGLKGVLSGLPRWPETPFFVIDIGGGSTEILAVKKLPGRQTTKPVYIIPAKCTIEMVSLPLGAVQLTEKYNQDNYQRDSPPSMHDDLDALLKAGLANLHIVSPLEEPGEKVPTPAPYLIASGGTATAAAALDLRLQKYDRTAVEGHCLKINNLQDHLQRLWALSVFERNNIPCLEAGRGEILPAGLIILWHTMTRIGARECHISDSGLLEGIFLESFTDRPLCFL